GVARCVLAPRIESAGCEHPQQVAGPAADLSHLGRALAALRTLAGAAARARRRRAERQRAGIGRRSCPILIRRIAEQKFSSCHGSFTRLSYARKNWQLLSLLVFPPQC